MAENPFAKWAQPDAGAEMPPPSGSPDNPFLEFTTGTPDTAPTARVTVRPSGVVPPEQGEGPEQPDMGAPAAFGIGAAQGVTANFGDEIAGVLGAGGGVPDTGRVTGFGPNAMQRALFGLARLGYETLTGQGQPQQPDPDQPPQKGPGTTAYEAARDKWRAKVEQAERQHPVAYTGGQVTGAVVTPIKAGAVAAPMRARVARSALVGGGMGAVAGAGEGTDLESRATQAATGGTIGSVVGGAAAPVSDLVVAGARRISQPVRRTVNRTFRPEREAMRRVARDLEADIQNDPAAATRLTGTEFVASPGSRLVDLGGNQTRRSLDTAAMLSPEGDTVVRNALRERAEGERNRFVDWARHTFNFPNPRETERALQREKRAIVGPRYRQAYADGDRAVYSPELERLAGSPDVAAAMAKAAKEGKSIAIAEGHGAFNPPVTVTPDGRVIFNKGTTGVPTYPNLQFWDYTKRALDDMVTKAERGGEADKARVLSGLRRMLRDELDEIVPSYRGARDSATEFFGASNASEAGSNFFGSGARYGRLEEAQEAIRSMNPLQRQLFQDAYVSRFIHELNNAKDRGALDQVWKRIARSENARRELDIALTPALRQELEVMTRLERIWASARDAVTDNSKTARRRADIEAGIGAGVGIAGTAAGAYNQSPETATIGAVVAALAGGRRVNERRIAERVARLLMSENPQAVQQAARLVAGNERLMNRLRQASTDAGTRALPPQTTGVIGPQAAGIGRADDDGERVPGPQQ